MDDKTGVSEVIILDKTYYYNQGIPYLYMGDGCGYAPVPAWELARIIMTQNELLLEKDC